MMKQEELERHEFEIEKITMNPNSTLNNCGICERRLKGFYVVVAMITRLSRPYRAVPGTPGIIGGFYTPAPKSLFRTFPKMKRIKVRPTRKVRPTIIRTSLSREICFFCALSLIERGKTKDKGGFYKKELTDWIEHNRVRLTLEEL